MNTNIGTWIANLDALMKEITEKSSCSLPFSGGGVSGGVKCIILGVVHSILSRIRNNIVHPDIITYSTDSINTVQKRQNTNTVPKVRNQAWPQAKEIQTSQRNTQFADLPVLAFEQILQKLSGPEIVALAHTNKNSRHKILPITTLTIKSLEYQLNANFLAYKLDSVLNTSLVIIVITKDGNQISSQRFTFRKNEQSQYEYHFQWTHPSNVKSEHTPQKDFHPLDFSLKKKPFGFPPLLTYSGEGGLTYIEKKHEMILDAIKNLNNAKMLSTVICYRNTVRITPGDAILTPPIPPVTQARAHPQVDNAPLIVPDSYSEMLKHLDEYRTDKIPIDMIEYLTAQDIQTLIDNQINPVKAIQGIDDYLRGEETKEDYITLLINKASTDNTVEGGGSSNKAHQKSPRSKWASTGNRVYVQLKNEIVQRTTYKNPRYPGQLRIAKIKAGKRVFVLYTAR
jgi:hypothetical protein